MELRNVFPSGRTDRETPNDFSTHCNVINYWRRRNRDEQTREESQVMRILWIIDQRATPANCRSNNDPTTRLRLGKRGEGNCALIIYHLARYRGSVIRHDFFLHTIHRVHRVVDTSFASFVGRPPRNLSIRSIDRPDKPSEHGE